MTELAATAVWQPSTPATPRWPSPSATSWAPRRGSRCGPPSSSTRSLNAVDGVLAALDRQASRFRQDSEISRVHRRDGGMYLLSDGLAEAVRVALAAARSTGGRTNPTVGRALIALGYDRDFTAVDPDGSGPVAAAAPAPGWRTVSLDGPVLRLPPGVRLDLGATAKGLGSDRAVRAVMAAHRQVGGVLVSLGGDIAVDGQPPATAGRSSSPTSRTRRPRPHPGGPARQRGGGDVVDHLPPVASGRARGAPHRGPADRRDPPTRPGAP